jgi:hypothetical protein
LAFIFGCFTWHTQIILWSILESSVQHLRLRLLLKQIVMGFNTVGLPAGLTSGMDDDSDSGDSSSMNDMSVNSSSSVVVNKGLKQQSSSSSQFSLARSDTVKVIRIKIIVFGVIGLCAIGCGTGALLYSRSNQENAFEHQVRTPCP